MASSVLFFFQLMLTEQLPCALFWPLGTELVEQDTLPAWRGFESEGEIGIRSKGDTNKRVIPGVVGANHARGLAQHWLSASGRWPFL